ncbi:MAG TPA: hypothetical protein VFH53_04285 [Phycisphaerae bacterium]|nr:hypothetical protein [Phycisphaerae bacterium]
MRAGLRHLRQELFSHLPFSVFSTVGGMMLVAILAFLGAPFYAGVTGGLPAAFKNLFHIFHPAHMLFSATATTAMFWKYERRFWKACIVGFLGAIVICGISDIFMPYLSGLLMGAPMEMHICILEHPQLVLPFTLVGIGTGFLAADHIVRATFFSHAAHVLVSSAASLLYLVSFGLGDWFHQAGLVFIFVVLAVTIPCCVSDIVFPLLAVTRDGRPIPHLHAHD